MRDNSLIIAKISFDIINVQRYIMRHTRDAKINGGRYTICIRDVIRTLKSDLKEDETMDYIMSELKKICDKESFKEEDCKILFDSAMQMLRIGKMAKHEGLFSLLSLLGDPDFLEDLVAFCEKYNVALLDKTSFEWNLCNLLEEVTMGVDREDIRKMGMVTMCTSNLSSLEFIQYAIWLEGVLDIQAGVHQRTIRKLVASYLPMNARKTFMEMTENE